MDVDESKKEDYSEAMNDPAFLQVSNNNIIFFIQNCLNSSSMYFKLSFL